MRKIVLYRLGVRPIRRARRKAVRDLRRGLKR